VKGNVFEIDYRKLEERVIASLGVDKTQELINSVRQTCPTNPWRGYVYIIDDDNYCDQQNKCSNRGCRYNKQKENMND